MVESRLPGRLRASALAALRRAWPWARRWRWALLVGLLALAATALPSLVREQPLVPPLLFAPLALDGLGAFFVLVLLLGASAALALGEPTRRVVLVGLPLILAVGADPLALTALALGVAALAQSAERLSAERSTTARRDAAQQTLFGSAMLPTASGRLHGLVERVRPPLLRRALLRALAALARVLPMLAAVLPALLLLAAAALLRQGGSWRWSSSLAEAGLSSPVFALLLAALLLGVLLHTGSAAGPTELLLLAPSWAYPLLRLYAFGAWNSGWHLAALLLSGTLLLWAAVGSLGARSPVRVALLLRATLAAALFSMALGSSAGLAAGAYGLLSYLLLAAALLPAQSAAPSQRGPAARWMLSAALPLTMPFVAAWMAVAAAVASATAASALALWLAALLVSVNLLFGPVPEVGPRWGLAALSLAGGILAPLLLQLLIMPLIEQLQGGLSPFGELAIWPWLGLAMLDSQRRQVATLPSLVVAGLLVVLLAICHLLARLLVPSPTPEAPAEPAAGDAAEPALLELLRRRVFWLPGGDRK